MKRAISSLFAMGILFAAAQTMAQTVEPKNVKPLTNSISVVTKLEPISYNYEGNLAAKAKLPTAEQYGFNSAELKKVLPNLVSQKAISYPAGKNSYNTATVDKVDNESLIPLLVASIQEQQQQIESLKRELDSLKSKNSR
ncbi:tail fiber domain-containing protein [Pedobacter sp. MW01-1-1]|uniref:tail fiber domain-containing protein n=1 Tax=Pedobacter sp. MW01-1-1 TaxID=3383027 RepID=UPI003FEF1273